MIRTQVYLPEELYREAKIQAHIQKTNVSTLIRKGLEHVVGRGKSRPKPTQAGKGFFGALTYGPKDLSTRINDIYK